MGKGKVMRLWNLWLATIIIFWFFVSCPVTKALHLSPKPRMRLSMNKKKWGMIMTFVGTSCD